MDIFKRLVSICGMTRWTIDPENPDKLTLFQKFVTREPVECHKIYTKDSVYNVHAHPTLVTGSGSNGSDDSIDEHVMNIRTSEDSEPGPCCESSCYFDFGTISWIYTCLIFSALLIHPVSLSIRNDIIVERKFYPWIPMVQYASAVSYHTTNHFDKWWNAYPETQNYKVTQQGLFGLAITIAFLQAAVFIPVNYDIFEWYNYIGLCVGFITSAVYITEFAFVFYKHSMVMDRFADSLLETEESMNELLKKVSRIRFDLEVSIGAFKTCFLIVSIIGVIPIGYLVNCLRIQDCDPDFPWAGIAYYLVFQASFLLMLRFIDNRKSEMQRVTKHTTFIKRYLNRLTKDELLAKYNGDTDIIIMDMLEDSATTADWMSFNSVCTEEWSNFSVLGIQLSGGEIFQKGVLIVGFILLIEGFFFRSNTTP